MRPFVHLKGLNGIRAIAATAVVIFHTGAFLPDFGFDTSIHTDLGGHGVSMFFALSGFLITYLLLLEKDQFKSINIKAFYIRRILRIWPLYYFFLGLVLATIYFYQNESLPRGFLYYVFLCGNVPYIFGFPYPLLIHFWSLGVEEQFYAFWPWVVDKSKKILRFLVWFTVLFLAVKFFFRYLYSVSDYKWPYQAMTVTRFDCMSIGAIGAILFLRKHKSFLKWSFSRLAQITAWGVIVLTFFNKFHLASVIDTQIVAALTVVLIVNLAGNSKTLINLEKPVFDFLGKISYGIYVYHLLIIFFAARIFKNLVSSLDFVQGIIFVYLLVFSLTIFVSYLSYRFLEKRFLALKLNFSKIRSASTAELVKTEIQVVAADPLNPVATD